jgi:hypothetical protein
MDDLGDPIPSPSRSRVDDPGDPIIPEELIGHVNRKPYYFKQEFNALNVIIYPDDTDTAEKLSTIIILLLSLSRGRWLACLTMSLVVTHGFRRNKGNRSRSR